MYFDSDSTVTSMCRKFCETFSGDMVPYKGDGTNDAKNTKRGFKPLTKANANTQEGMEIKAGIAAKSSRGKAWMVADPNGNGLLSLAEVDGWIQKTLLLAFPDDEEGLLIWKRFRPSYIRAFNDAKDIGTDKKIGRTITTDDYVQKGEFRLLNAYLCIYAVMFDAFALIDGYQPGETKAVTGADDRRMGIEEWKSAYKNIMGHGFVAFEGLGDDNASLEKAFKDMDADGKGMVLLREFCEYIEKKEEAAGTEWGKMLGIGDGDQAK